MEYKNIEQIESRLQHIKQIKNSIFFKDILEKLTKEEHELNEKLKELLLDN